MKRYIVTKEFRRSSDEGEDHVIAAGTIFTAAAEPHDWVRLDSGDAPFPVYMQCGSLYWKDERSSCQDLERFAGFDDAPSAREHLKELET